MIHRTVIGLVRCIAAYPSKENNTNCRSQNRNSDIVDSKAYIAIAEHAHGHVEILLQRTVLFPVIYLMSYPAPYSVPYPSVLPNTLPGHRPAHHLVPSKRRFQSISSLISKLASCSCSYQPFYPSSHLVYTLRNHLSDTLRQYCLSTLRIDLPSTFPVFPSTYPAIHLPIHPPAQLST